MFINLSIGLFSKIIKKTSNPIAFYITQSDCLFLINY